MPNTGAPGPSTVAATYPGRPDQVRAIRADLRGALEGCPVADDVILCASELAANAATHSRSGQPGGWLAVRVELRPGESVLVEVGDEGGRWAGAGHDDDRPHGLDIVQAIAGDGNFGVRGSAINGRVVWTRLGWDAAS
jgi:anti-sigma regulatory factor (Ser/Thr protein kinase)